MLKSVDKKELPAVLGALRTQRKHKGHPDSYRDCVLCGPSCSLCSKIAAGDNLFYGLKTITWPFFHLITEEGSDKVLSSWR